MPEITVPAEDRPAIWKYVGYTALRWLVVVALVGGTLRNVVDPAFGLVLLALAGAVNLVILFGAVELLVEAWFAAAVVAEE